MARNEFFFALYTSWSAVWLIVMLAYVRVAFVSWREEAGQWRLVPGECYGFLRWFAVNLWQDFRHGFRHYEEQMPQRYSAGHFLRFFITLGAFVCGVMGLGTSMVNRDPWSFKLCAFIAVAVAASIFAGLGHLAVAWQNHPRRWRMTVIALAVWFPLAVWIR